MTVMAGYVRVSTEEQVASGLSLEAQEKALRAFAEGQGADFRLYADPGASGSRLSGRPALAALLGDAASRRFDAVVVTRLDRLARDTRDALDVARELERRGILLLDLSCPLPNGGAFGAFTFTLRAAVAKLERDLIAERTSAALRAKAERGEWTGGRPPIGLRQEGSRLLPDPVGLRVASTIRQLAASGHSLREIAAALTLEGVPTARGGRWHAETVRQLLNNPRVTTALAEVAERQEERM